MHLVMDAMVDDDGSVRSDRSEQSKNEKIVMEPFMGMKVRGRASLHRDCEGDYLDVPSDPHLMKILSKQGLPIIIYFFVFDVYDFLASMICV